MIARIAMTMAPVPRKLVLTLHITSSVGWLGAAASFVVLTLAGLASQEAQPVRAVYLAAEPITTFALVPLALTSLATGLVMALGTPWGLFRHYWVLLSLVLTVLCTVVLLQFTQTVRAFAGAALAAGGADPRGLASYLLHSGVGLLVLLAITALNVFKPRGLTPYGWRKQQEERARQAWGASAASRLAGPSAPPTASRAEAAPSARPATSGHNGTSSKGEETMPPKQSGARFTTLVTLALLLAACAPAPALAPSTSDPAQPYAGLQRRTIKALAPERVADLLAGRGASYALPAELNSYPGPRHVLDLAAALALTPAQRGEAEAAYAAMQAAAKQLGAQLVEQEALLDRAFSGGSATADEVGRLAGEAAATEGRLRTVHLRAHLAMKTVLTPEQIAQYDRLRGYAGNAAAGGGHDRGATHGASDQG